MMGQCRAGWSRSTVPEHRGPWRERDTGRSQDAMEGGEESSRSHSRNLARLPCILTTFKDTHPASPHVNLCSDRSPPPAFSPGNVNVSCNQKCLYERMRPGEERTMFHTKPEKAHLNIKMKPLVTSRKELELRRAAARMGKEG